MREGMERADVRFSNFQLLLSTGISLRVDYEYPWSTAPGGLTFTSSLVGGCKSIFEAPFDAGDQLSLCQSIWRIRKRSARSGHPLGSLAGHGRVS